MSEWGDNKLKKIHGDKLIGHMLVTAKERQDQAHIWRFVGDKKMMAGVRLDIILLARGEFVFSPLPGQEEAFAHVMGASDNVNFFLPHACLLFQSPSKGRWQAGGWVAKFPEFLAQVERRKWLRMAAEGDPRLRAQFSKQVALPRPSTQFFGKTLLDLGAGGASLAMSRAEARFFTPGEDIRNFELLVDGRKIRITAKVLRVQEVALGEGRPRGWKVSLRFDAIDPKDQDHLCKFVFQNLGDRPVAV